MRRGLGAWLGPQAAAHTGTQPLVGIVLAAAIALLSAVDTGAPIAISAAALIVFLVSVAGWLLAARWTLALVILGMALQMVDALRGQLEWLSASTTSIALAATAVGVHVGTVSFVALRETRRREVELLARAADLVSRPTPVDAVLHQIVAAASQAVATSDATAPRRASLVRVRDGRLTIVAEYDESDHALGAGASVAAGSASPAFSEALATGLPRAVVISAARVGAGPADGQAQVRQRAFARVMAGGRPYGVLTVASCARQPLRRTDLEVLQAVADLAGIAIDSALRQAEMDALRERLQVGVDLALDIGSSLDPGEVTTRILRRAVRAMDADRATLSRIEGDRLHVEAVFDRNGGQALTWPGTALPLTQLRQQPAVAKALDTLRPAAGTRVDVESAAPEVRESLRQVRQAAVMPLVVGGRAVGTLVLSRGRDRAFTERDLAKLAEFGGVAVLALRNSWAFSEAEAAREREAIAGRRLRLAVEAAEQVGSETELSQVTSRLLRRAVDAVGADRGTVCRVEGDELVIDWNYDREGRDIEPGTRLRLDLVPETRDTLRSRRPDRSHPLRWPLAPGPSGVRPLDGVLHSLLYPLVVGGEAVGLMTLSRRVDRPFRDDDVLELRQFTSLAALLIRNARLLAEARELSQAKSSFLNLAAHELRTPLSVVRGYVSLLQDGTLGTGGEVRGDAIRVISEKTEELSRLVEGLLDAARLQAGGVRVEPEVFDLREAAAAAVRRAAARAELADATLDLDAPPDPVWVRADPLGVGRILDNLLNNALTYRGDDGRIAVRVEACDTAVVSVEDHGIGIGADHRARIFERFYRVEGGLSGRTVGAGLGLSISRDLAELNGGTLRLERTEPGAGSVFALRLPAAGAAPGPDDSAGSEWPARR